MPASLPAGRFSRRSADEPSLGGRHDIELTEHRPDEQNAKQGRDAIEHRSRTLRRRAFLNGQQARRKSQHSWARASHLLGFIPGQFPSLTELAQTVLADTPSKRLPTLWMSAETHVLQRLLRDAERNPGVSAVLIAHRQFNRRVRQ